MKVIALFALILVCTQATDFKSILQRGKELFANNQCFQQKVEQQLAQFALEVKNYKYTPTVDVFGELINKALMVKVAFAECQPNHQDILANIGEALLLGSQCMQDLGAMFLLADTIIQDPTNILNDLVVALFLAIYSQQTIQDCGNFIQFIESLIPHNNTMIAY